jgi:hypothetical protein
MLPPCALQANGIPADARPTDCAWRGVAVDYATKVAGAQVGCEMLHKPARFCRHLQLTRPRSLASLRRPDVHDALEIGRLCPDGARRPAEVAKAHMLPGQRGAWLNAEIVLHVSSTASGGGDGTEAKPLTLMEARDAVRSIERASRPATTVLLDGGEHFLGGATLELTELDGGRAGAPVVWAAAPGEEPVISGASRLDLSWSKWTGEGAAPGVFVADLPPDAPDFKSMYVDGNRYWPARWPNGDPRYNLFPDSCKQSLPRMPTKAQVSLTGL